MKYALLLNSREIYQENMEVIKNALLKENWKPVSHFIERFGFFYISMEIYVYIYCVAIDLV